MKQKSLGMTALSLVVLLGGCAVDSTSGEQELEGKKAAIAPEAVDGEEPAEAAAAVVSGDEAAAVEQSQAIEGDYWVGILMVGSTCPAGTSKVSFYLDMEDNGIDSGTFTNWHTGYNSHYTERSASWASGSDLRGSGFRFNWCRVNGEKFKPLTTDAFSYENFYSVLKLSSNCPPGSQERGIYLDTEDSDPSNSSSGNIAPNAVAANNATLKFCQFTAGASTMSSFPSFKDANGAAVQYSVLHDFDDTTPPSWVINKKFVYWDDEDNNCQSKYLQAKPAILLASDPYATFTAAVERYNDGGDWGTFFDFAQVK
jgi:hypothetical protein